MEVNRFNPIPVSTDDGRRHGEGVENRFFRRFNRRGDERIQVRIGQLSQGIGVLFRVMRNHIGSRKGQDEVAAPVTSRGTGPGQTERGPLGQSGQLPGI